MDSEKKAFLKNFIWNSLGTGINSFNSLFFLIIVTRVNDIQTAGIFSIGYATATILYTLAMYSGRLCQVTDIEGKIKDKDYIAQRALTCILMLIGAAIFLVIQQYTGFKTMVFALLAIFKGIEAFSDILYGVMQKNDILYKSGQSLTIKGFVGIALFLIVDLITRDIRWACFAVILEQSANRAKLACSDVLFVTSDHITERQIVINFHNLNRSEKSQVDLINRNFGEFFGIGIYAGSVGYKKLAKSAYITHIFIHGRA